LAATSRKFEKPLGVIIQSTSAAGKTTLMEAILAMMPDKFLEELTTRAVNYLRRGGELVKVYRDYSAHPIEIEPDDKWPEL